MYSIIGRHKVGTSVMGYVLRDERTGTMSIKDRDTTYELALDKRVNNVRAQMYQGTVVMKGISQKLTELPLYDSEMRPIIEGDEPLVKENLVTGKVLCGKNVVSYRITHTVNGIPIQSRILSKDTVIDLARKGLIDNARAQRCNGNDILRGLGKQKLYTLPVIGKVEEVK